MKIYSTDCDQGNMNIERNILRSIGEDLIEFDCKTEDDIIKNCKGAVILINQFAPMTRRVFDALAPELKQIVRSGVGVNNVDLKAATDHGVQVCNVPDYGMNEVADQTMTLMLALVRKICIVNEYTRKVKWDYRVAVPIYRIPGSTVGIIGLGRNGQTFAKRLTGFDCKILGYDEYCPKDKVPKNVELVSFERLIKESDVISIHCPLTEETRDMFNLETFKKMKNTAYLINTSRGNIVNEADLLIALKEKIIAGAALDAVSKEPMPLDSELFKLDNFICTPHIAWYSEEAFQELKRKVGEEAYRFAKGEPVHYPVNKLK